MYDAEYRRALARINVELLLLDESNAKSVFFVERGPAAKSWLVSTRPAWENELRQRGGLPLDGWHDNYDGADDEPLSLWMVVPAPFVSRIVNYAPEVTA